MATSGPIEFHRSDMCIVSGDKSVSLTAAEGVVFYNLWSRRGEWVSIPDIMTSLDGKPIPSVGETNLAKRHIFAIRKKLREAGLDAILIIENQRQSWWVESKYRIP